MTTKPDLKITNPYALDETQFAAAVDLLKQQKPAIAPVLGRLHQADGRLRDRRRDRRHDLADHHQPAAGRGPAGRGRRHQADRGRDRLVRHLDDQLQDQAPELRLQVASTTSSRPRSTPRSPSGSARRRQQQVLRADRGRPGHCDDLPRRATTPSGRTSGTGRRPTTTCVDGRTDVKCKGFDDWIKAWTEIKG